MEKLALTAQIREKAGKGVARSLRRNQRVPAVLYSHGESTPISMGNKDMTKILNTEGGEHALINLKLEGGTGEKLALIKDYQIDPTSGSLIHVDLMEVALDEKVKIPVDVHVSGSSIGVKEGGIFQYGLRSLDIECLPNLIPEHIEVDITNLKINESLHVRDITVAEGIRILTDGDATVATIQPPISDAKLEAMLTATPAAGPEAGEPELVKKPKKEEEGAAPAAETKGKEGAKETAAAPKKEAAPAAAAKKEAAPKK
ncbi:MAG TPA: 50S ribosomal protein L25 [Nitrospirota bacterium]|nr:50S ribosomal protein L25 [Nitrospirota bacterium]